MVLTRAELAGAALDETRPGGFPLRRPRKKRGALAIQPDNDIDYSFYFFRVALDKFCFDVFTIIGLDYSRAITSWRNPWPGRAQAIKTNVSTERMNSQ